MTVVTPWPLPEARTLAEQVYRAVRARIMDGALAPGAFLREKDLESMGVSRTPIREALGRLASEGFLERLPHRGFRVPEESLGNLLELYPIVASLELLAGRLALDRFAASDLAELKEVNQRLGRRGTGATCRRCRRRMSGSTRTSPSRAATGGRP